MEKVSQEQIHCVFEGDNDIIIFDNDHWNDQKKQISSTQHTIPEQASDRSILMKIDNQIKESKENFYKVQIKQTEKKSKKSQKVIELKAKKDNSILKEGYMEKKTDGFFFNWHVIFQLQQIRYIVLTPEKLYTFQTETREKVIGCVNLKVLTAKLKEVKDTIVLDFHGECENLILKTSNKEQQKSWKKWLQSVLDYNGKENKLMLKTMIKPIYDSKDSLTEKQFLKNAQTGDILLFFTENLGAKVQRLFTSSDYDHVAMVLKFKNKQLMVFQSNQMHGVSVYDWKSYINYFDLYSKVTLRKLNYVRKADAQQSIIKFARKNIGKKYEISAMKLLQFQSDFDWENAKEDRGYFCSQLIGKIFKSIGLLDDKKSCGRYWPVDFAQKSELKLLKGAFLGAEQMVILNKHIKNAL